VDRNNDKSISFEEYSGMMKKRKGRSGQPLKDDWIKDMFTKKDIDGDASLSYQELARPVKP
jgi:Ca2+-binding EF-hand superfamily protein